MAVACRYAPSKSPWPRSAKTERVIGVDPGSADPAWPGPTDDLVGQRATSFKPALDGRQERLVVAEVPAEKPTTVFFADPQAFGCELTRFSPLASMKIVDAEFHQRHHVPSCRPALASAEDRPPKGLAHLSQAVCIDCRRRDVLDDGWVGLLVNRP